MEKRIIVFENGIHAVWEINDEGILKLLHFAACPFEENTIRSTARERAFNFVEMNLSGFDRPYERHGNKYVVTAPGYRLKYVNHEDTRNDMGRRLVFVLRDELTDVYVDAAVQFFDGISVVRVWQRVRNEGTERRTLEYLSSFNLMGIEKEGTCPPEEKMAVFIPHHGWQRELNWKMHTLNDMGMDRVQPLGKQRSSNFLSVSNTGNWSAKEYLPMGYVENREIGNAIFFQIEHNGSWHWEMGEQDGHFYLALSGPDEMHSHWYEELEPGESFTGVPVSVGVTSEGFDAAMGELTKYRRRIRRKNKDNETLPVIFNDYMNCLWGQPAAELEIPLVDAAAEAGCEYFCIDCGWYSDGPWWDSVGEWKESRKRFPDGVKRIADYIRSRGMIPGLWLEIEVMGIHCRLAHEMPDSWFFMRHGKRVYDRSRYQLDFGNPEVCAYADTVIDRLVGEYGIGYIKMDYNIEPGIGTENGADSTGGGLLNHERGYLKWLDGIFERYPDLVIENCSSGGLRMDYAMLSRYSIQSTSDQENYLHYATIAANAPTAVTPEQGAVWTYPMEHGEETDKVALQEEVVFNMVNAMLLRIHQSGHLARLDEGRRMLVREALSVYRRIRKDIKEALPFWPLGLSAFGDEWVCLGLRNENRCYLAVWRREGCHSSRFIPIQELKGRQVEAACIYPAYHKEGFAWQQNTGIFSVCFEREKMARLFLLEEKRG